MAKEVKYIIKVKDSASRVLKGISGSFRKMAGGLKSGFAKLRGSWIAGFLSMAGAVVAFKKVIGASFKFEAMTRDFKVLLGSMEEAEKRMRVLGSITSGTRFELKGVAEASKHLHTLSEGAMGGAASLRLVGDAAASTNQEIEDVGYWFGKAYGAIRDGKPFDNAASSLRDMGVLSADARDRMEELQKSGGMASEIFKILQDDLQQFSGGMEEATATGNDLVAELRGSVQGAIKDVGDEFQEASKGGLQTLINKVNELRDSGALVAWVDKWQQRFEKALPTLSRMAQGLGNIADTIERRYSRLGGTVGAILGGASIKDALEIGKQVVSDEDDRAARVQAKAMLDRVAEKAQAEKEAAESAYKEQQKIDADLAKADLKQIERNAAKRAKEEEKAAKKILAAEKKLASEKEKLQKKIAAAEERSVKDALLARKKAIDDEIRYREQRIQDAERDLAEKKEQFGKGFSERARDRREAKEEQDNEERIRRAAERGEKKLARQNAGIGRKKDKLTSKEREAVEIARLERDIAADKKKTEELKRDQAKAAAEAMARENARAAAELKANRDALAELEAVTDVTISSPEIDPVPVELNVEDDASWLDDAKEFFDKPIDVDINATPKEIEVKAKADLQSIKDAREAIQKPVEVDVKVKVDHSSMSDALAEMGGPKLKGNLDESMTLRGRTKSRLEQLAANNIESGFSTIKADGAKMNMRERKEFKKAEKKAKSELTAQLALKEAKANITSAEHLAAIAGVIASTDKGA